MTWFFCNSLGRIHELYIVAIIVTSEYRMENEEYIGIVLNNESSKPREAKYRKPYNFNM